MKNQFQNLNLNYLIHFHSIAKYRSLRLAAKNLNLSAPAVTHSLNNLEVALGETLCIRNRSEFSLTEVGLRLFESTQVIFSELEGFSLSSNDEKEFAGSLSIGVLDHFENERLQHSLREVIKRFPKIKLDIQSYSSEQINELLVSKSIDCGISVFSHKSPRLKYTSIGHEELRYYISKWHPLWKKKSITKDDLLNQKVTWLDNRTRSRADLEMNVFVKNLKYKMQFHGFSNNLSAAFQILMTGHTVVPLPTNYARPLLKIYPIRELKIETKVPSLSQDIAYNPAHVLSPPMKMLLEYFKLNLEDS